MIEQEILLVVEGLTDRPVAKKLLRSVGLQPGKVVDTGGKNRLDARLPGFRLAARAGPVLVLRDLDHDASCAAEFVAQALPASEPLLVFRIAVRSSEAWLLADGDKIAEFLHIRSALVPMNPDALDSPKRTLVDLARGSTKPEIVRLMVPEPGKSGVVGPGYASVLGEFVEDHWRPEIARQNSNSLHRCLLALERLAAASAPDAEVPTSAGPALAPRGKPKPTSRRAKKIR